MIHYLVVALGVYLALSVLLVGYFYWATSEARQEPEQILNHEERALWEQIERHWQ